MAQKQRSKSTSSIPEDQDMQWKMRCEELQKIRDLVRESEEQWREDLCKWKNHRRSVNSDMVRKREERKHNDPAASGSTARKSDTFWGMQGEESREQGAPVSDSAASPFTRQAVSVKPQPCIRSTVLPQSYAVDSPYATATQASAPSAPLVQRDSSCKAGLSYDSAFTYTATAQLSIQTRAGPASSASTSKARTNQAGTSTAAPIDPIGTTVPGQTSTTHTHPTSTTFACQTSTALTDRVSTVLPEQTSRIAAEPSRTSQAEESSACSVYRASEPGRPIGRLVGEKSSGSLYNLNSMDTKPAASQVSASLPRSTRRSDSSRLASVVSPRPFGTQSTRISPVSRVFAVDDSHKRFNGETNESQNSIIFSHKSKVLNLEEDDDHCQTSSVPSRNEDKEEKWGMAASNSPPFAPQSSCMTLTVTSGSESRSSEMRIRLNQKPNSSQDFGFQTSWDSTGKFIKSIQKGSPAELSQLQVGDEIVAVDGRKASEMSLEQWKGSMDGALQQGSVALDVRRNGQNSTPTEYMNSSNEFNSQPAVENATKMSHTFNSQDVTGVESKGMNGGFRPESVGKESETISLKNIKRRSEFFEKQGGSESAISDLRVPSISTTSNRHSWDPMEERKRQEKWQQEQERLLQEKYKRDQEKMEQEWRRAQQNVVSTGMGYSEEEQRSLEVDTRSLSPLSPMSPLSQTTPPLWEEPSHMVEREGPQLTQLQGGDPHKDKVLRRGDGEEMTLQNKCEEEQQKTRAVEEEEEKKCQQASEGCFTQQGSQEQERKGDYAGVAKIHPEISLSDREKSKSSPELDEVDKPTGMASVVSSGRKTAPSPSQEARERKQKNRPLSQVELDRLQILEEMKKRTQLLTDSSWIRQRSSTIYKEPIHLGGGMRRYESLDNLNTARSWRQSQWPPSPASSSRPQSAVSGSASSTLPTSFSTGSLRQGPWSQPSPTSPTPPTALNEEPGPEPHPPSQQRCSALTAGLTSEDPSLELEQELKSDCETGSSTATPATPDSQQSLSIGNNEQKEM
ncbi:hypothetical protein AGOR_G00216340 [Albula goreensis]|uniref:PDZ domain-containing protein n=1 Tax=Albula goreensis TaxID=1534307 RepID=A0A8T3CP87_9TELE|nr:hypothetical protein AGOR_G00216340 [Albula goreensis]